MSILCTLNTIATFLAVGLASLQLRLTYQTQQCNRTRFRQSTAPNSWWYNFDCKALQSKKFTRFILLKMVLFLAHPVQLSVYACATLYITLPEVTSSLWSIVHFTHTHSHTHGHARYYLSVSKNVWSFGLTTWPTRPHHKREKFYERAWCGPLLLSRLLCKPPTRPHNSLPARPPAHVHPSVYCLSCTNVSLRKTKSRKRFAFW